MTDTNRFDKCVNGVAAKRLTFDHLTRKQLSKRSMPVELKESENDKDKDQPQGPEM
jgi:hypothetical protein